MLDVARTLIRLSRLPLVVALLVLTLAGCESHTSVQGGAGSDSGGAGRIKIGLPF
jgi:hypothetical protein